MLKVELRAASLSFAAALAPFMPRVEATDLMLDTQMDFSRGR